MKRSSSSRRLRVAAALAFALAFAAIVAGLQRASVAQSEAAIRLDAAVSFPVDI